MLQLQRNAVTLVEASDKLRPPGTHHLTRSVYLSNRYSTAQNTTLAIAQTAVRDLSVLHRVQLRPLAIEYRG
jgi:hypothetical protein